MIKGKDIIVIGIQPWDIEIGSNCKNIAIEFAKHNRVLYVNGPLDRKSKYKEKDSEKVKKRLRIINGEEPNLVKLENNLWTLYPRTIIESINWMKPNFIFDYFNLRNGKKFAKYIKEAADELGFKDYILFNDSSMFLGLHLKKQLSPSLYVYYIRDFLVKYDYWNRHGERVEPKLIKKADVVVNNSMLYAEYAQQWNTHSYMVGQGCDTSLFNDLKVAMDIPDDLKDIPKPIIGYVGSLTDLRLSIEIIEYIAKARPDWSVVLVGPKEDGFKTCNLNEIDNIYFLGSKDGSVLPNYIKGFDVAMNPQLMNEVTMGNYPRKIDEYLTMGKPTLATATKAMEYFKDYTYLGLTKEDYVTLAEKAMAEDSEELQLKRRACGTSHSWENNIAAIYDCIEKVAKEKGISI
jgi:glycosyltransferase involved in cell wall biosynthesis